MYNGGTRSGFSRLVYIIGRVSGETLAGQLYSNQYVCVTAGQVQGGSQRLAFRMSDRHNTAAAAKSACLPTSQLTTSGDYVLPKTANDCSGVEKAAGVVAATAALIAAVMAVGLGSRSDE